MRSLTRESLILAFFAATVSLLGCDGSPLHATDVGGRHDYAASEGFQFDVSAGSGSRLRLEGVNGGITVTGSPDATSVTIAGERRVGADSQGDAGAHLDELEVRVDDLGGEIHVKTIPPHEAHGRTYVVDYEITLPTDVEVVLSNVNGRVQLSGILGSCNVAVVNGQIDSRVSLPTDGVIDLSTVNGEVRLSIPTNTSAQMSATVVNGHISVSNLSLQDSLSTRRSLQGNLGGGRGRISLSTVNGNIDVTGR